MKLIKNKKFNPDLAEVNKDSELKAKLGLGDKLKTEIFPSTTIAVYFKLNTGDEEFHLVTIKKKSFELYKKMYLVDTKYLTYNRTLKMFMGTYHEDISLPIKQIINVSDLKTKLEQKTKYAPVSSNINPEILKDFSKSKVIQDTLNGHALSSVMGFLKVTSVIIILLTALNLILSAQMSGLFSK